MKKTILTILAAGALSLVSNAEEVKQPIWTKAFECKKENAGALNVYFLVAENCSKFRVEMTQAQLWGIAIYGQHKGFIQMEGLIIDLEKGFFQKAAGKIREVNPMLWAVIKNVFKEEA